MVKAYTQGPATTPGGFPAFLAGATQFVMWEVFTFTLSDGSQFALSTRDGPVPTANAGGGGGGNAAVDYVLDSFTGTLGETLLTHVGEVGAAWTGIFGDGAGEWQLLGNGRLVDVDTDLNLVQANGVVPADALSFNITLNCALPTPVVRPAFFELVVDNPDFDGWYLNVVLGADGGWGLSPDSVTVQVLSNLGNAFEERAYFGPTATLQAGESLDVILCVEDHLLTLVRPSAGCGGVIAYTHLDGAEPLPVGPFRVYMAGRDAANGVLIGQVEVGGSNAPCLRPHVRDFFDDAPGVTLDFHGGTPMGGWSGSGPESSATDWALDGNGSVFVSGFQIGFDGFSSVSADTDLGIIGAIPDGAVAPTVMGVELITTGLDLTGPTTLQVRAESDTTSDGLFLAIILSPDPDPDQVTVTMPVGNGAATLSLTYAPPGDKFNGPVSIFACMPTGHNQAVLLVDGVQVAATAVSALSPVGNLSLSMVWEGDAATGLLIDTVDMRPLEFEP